MVNFKKKPTACFNRRQVKCWLKIRQTHGESPASQREKQGERNKARETKRDKKVAFYTA